MGRRLGGRVGLGLWQCWHDPSLLTFLITSWLSLPFPLARYYGTGMMARAIAKEGISE
jgi:hypothetical protein